MLVRELRSTESPHVSVFYLSGCSLTASFIGTLVPKALGAHNAIRMPHGWIEWAALAGVGESPFCGRPRLGPLLASAAMKCLSTSNFARNHRLLVDVAAGDDIIVTRGVSRVEGTHRVLGCGACSGTVRAVCCGPLSPSLAPLDRALHPCFRSQTDLLIFPLAAVAGHR